MPCVQHQANLALFDGTGKSLLMRWVEAVADEYSKYVGWPLKSVKLDDLYTLYKAREARDACKLDYTLNVTNGNVTSVSVAAGSKAACTAPLLLPPATAGGAAQAVSVSVPAGGTGSTTRVAGVKWPAA